MKRMIRCSGAAVLLALAGCTATTTAVAPKPEDADKVVGYFRKKVNLPASAAPKVTDLKASPIPGAGQGVIEVGNQKQPFLLSSDGRYAVFGSVEDLTVNPFEAVMKKISLTGRAIKGPETAKVTIVEYSDFQCPYCARGYQTVENEVLKEYGDKVRFVYKHFPLNFHPWAELGAVAVECARQQNEPAYWKLYSAFFDHQRDVNPQNLKEKSHEYMAGTNIDKAQFDDCLDNKKTADLVKADQQEGTSVGVNGTPAFIINGRLLSGAQPAAAFKAIIDDELASQK
ncbi:MAG: thioredoxin domain-containing protein [Deltaproteobacteria bacterium]|nr:thioredoxin domain-containing protein [Deltaproteobacteria bacterium]